MVAGRTMTLHLTGPAIRFSETSRALQPARQKNSVLQPHRLCTPNAGVGRSISPEGTQFSSLFGSSPIGRPAGVLTSGISQSFSFEAK
jgi:hypothetical protein